MILSHRSAATITAAIRAGKVSAREVIEDTLQRIDVDNATLNCFTDITAERALAEADAVDAALRAGRPVGALCGVPYAVKNLFDIAGYRTLAGSKINKDSTAARDDATLVARMKRAGAVLIGATNMGEYAYDFTGENIHYGASRNPHDIAHMSGGSSGGSAVAVAGQLVPLALGSDTNGSIRVPAALCGIFGLKPTYGRLSRGGTFPFVHSLDHVGPFARCTKDLALAYDAMQGPDARDPAASAARIQPVYDDLGSGIDGLRIAVADDYFAQLADDDILSAVARVAQAVSSEKRVTVVEAARARAAAFVITACEGAALHRARLRERLSDFDPAVRNRLLAGTLIPATWYIQAQRFRRWFRDETLRLFARVDALLIPATPCRAPLIGQQTMTLNGVEMAVRPNLGLFTQPISFIGLPVVTVPINVSGLPIGVQIVAPPWREDIALRIAQHLESLNIAVAAQPQPCERRYA